MTIRLVAIDIDGTLIDRQGVVPPRNLAALDAAYRAGIEVVIATGRRFEFARPVIEQLPCPVTALVSNGAILRLPDGSTPLRRLMPVEVARTVLGETAIWRDGAALAFDRPGEGQVVFERIDWDHPARRAYAERSRGFIRETAPLEDALVEDPLQVMFNGTVDSMRALVAQVASGRAGQQVSIAATEYPARDFALVDALTAGCSKGSMLTAWMERRGYARDEVMALGDNLNDIEMLEAAGRPVLMGNAVPEMAGRGWATTGRCDEGGVGEAIERWVLGG